MSYPGPRRPFSYMQMANLNFIEGIYEKYVEDPSSVEASWRQFFEGAEFGECSSQINGKLTDKGDLRVFHLIEAYRKFGHLAAAINPIQISDLTIPKALQIDQFGFSEKDLDKTFFSEGLLEEKEAPLSKILQTLKDIYCGRIAIEYMGVHSPELKKWLQDYIKATRFKPNFSPEQKKAILHQLNKAELFEIFLHTKYVGQKRFSLEGGETLISLLSMLIEEGAELGMEEFVIGMAHRGRLNVLANILQKSFSQIFSEFEDYSDPNFSESSGDVKYHKGFSSDIETRKEKKVHVSLTSNPSHLESVNPVVQGKVRAKQVQKADEEKKRVIPLLIHGDASVAGQGIVYETLQFSQIKGYANGGTLHVVVDNHIGFTTLPHEYRTTLYSSDIARAFESPVFHVNAEDPEKCAFAAIMAAKIRQLFHIDVFIVLHCYRKYGHNESDEPAFTQPIEYEIIRSKKSIREIYRDSLIEEGVVEKEIALSLEEEFKKSLHYELEELKLTKKGISQEGFSGIWKGYRKPDKKELFEPCETAVREENLKKIAKIFCKAPSGIAIHKKLLRLIEQREKMIEEGVGIDWAMAEHLCLASLLWEGVDVRLSGQDSQRGTFSQRHAVWTDQKTGEKYFPLCHLKKDQGRFDVYNSPLSEFGAIGFEFGYSLASPNTLVLWEAQFGDFANGGQVIFDQYLCCSEQKWNRLSAMTVLLPHGYEGQGAEHSSARIERFLQLSAEVNMQVVYPTTPAQYFHVLRRQAIRKIRFPLIIFTPKGLLRHPKCVSPLNAFFKGSFEEIIEDENLSASRLAICCGRIYYDIVEEREKRKKQLAIIRIEQLYPLDKEKLTNLLKKYERIKEVVWIQEEPKNMGAYHYIYPELMEILSKKVSFKYVGRKESASSATGSHTEHEKQHKELMEKLFENL